MLNRTKQLQEEGFRQIRSLPVLLPHQLWKVDIEVEEERPLRHVDETVLRLVDAGVTGREDLMELMGTEPDVAVPRALGRLLKHGALSPQDGGFRITRLAKRICLRKSRWNRRLSKVCASGLTHGSRNFIGKLMRSARKRMVSRRCRRRNSLKGMN